MYNITLYRPKDHATFNLFCNENNYQVAKVTGLDAADRTLITAKTTLQFGGVYNGWAVNDREVVLEVKINGNIETNRNLLLDFLRKYDLIRIYITTYQKQLYIDTYISSIDYDIYSNSEKMIISFLAPYPYFSKVYIKNDSIPSYYDNTLQYLYDYHVAHNGMPQGLTFPDNIRAEQIHARTDIGSTYDVTFTPTKETGLIALMNVWSSGSDYLNLTNDTTGQRLKIDVTGLNYETDLIYIDTRPTFKQIMICQSGVFSNGSKRLLSGSEWITVKPNMENSILSVGSNGRQRGIIIGVIDEYEGI